VDTLTTIRVVAYETDIVFQVYVLCELLCFIICPGNLICFVVYTFDVQRFFHIFSFMCHMHIHHVERLCNTTCVRVKVHLVTVCHAEETSRVAQGSGVTGLWTVISRHLP